MKIFEMLQQAMEEVEKANIPDDLKSVAFMKAVDLVALGTGMGGGKEIQGGRITPIGVEATGLQRIANKLSLEEDIISQVFHIEENEVELVFPSIKLPSGKKAATEKIALLIAVGREGSGIDEKWTSTEEVRKWCLQFNKYDSPNFAKTIKNMSDKFLIRGKPANREISVSKPGWEQARRLVQELAGGSEE